MATRQPWFIAGVCCTCLLAGCMTLLERQVIRYGPGYKPLYEANMSSGLSPGVLFIVCRATARASVEQYVIGIAGRPPIRVAKECDVKIWLDPGTYTVTVAPLTSGRAAERRVVIAPGTQTGLVYQGPYWPWSAGSLRVAMRAEFCYTER